MMNIKSTPAKPTVTIPVLIMVFGEFGCDIIGSSVLDDSDNRNVNGHVDAALAGKVAFASDGDGDGDDEIFIIIFLYSLCIGPYKD